MESLLALAKDIYKKWVFDTFCFIVCPIGFEPMTPELQSGMLPLSPQAQGLQCEDLFIWDTYQQRQDVTVLFIIVCGFKVMYTIHYTHC